MEIWNPVAGDSLEGTFEGFAEFRFKENETTWLPAIRCGLEIFALPAHWKIQQAFRNEVDRLNVGDRVFIKFLGEVETTNGRRMFDYIIEIADRKVLDHRIITPAEMRALFSSPKTSLLGE
jgi:hypothetical protein